MNWWQFDRSYAAFSRISPAQLAQLHLLLSSLVVLLAPLRPHQGPAQSWAFPRLYLINTDKVSGAVVNDEALSFPDKSGVLWILFLRSHDFVGMLQSRMLDVTTHAGYLPDCSPLAALGLVLQSQNSASGSTEKLSSQHILHCSESLATLSVRHRDN